jgi:hypothetical protein
LNPHRYEVSSIPSIRYIGNNNEDQNNIKDFGVIAQDIKPKDLIDWVVLQSGQVLQSETTPRPERYK